MWRLPKPKFKVLMYGPDLPSGGVPGLAHFDPGVLVLEGRGYWYTVQSSRIGLKAGGFDGRQWLITWESPAGPMTAMLQGDEAVDAFIQLVPPEISVELRRVRGVHLRREAGFRVAAGLIVLLVLLAALALGLLWLNADRVSQWAAARISLELDADPEGLKLPRRAGMPAEGLGACPERLAERGRPPVVALSAHPAGTERLAALRDAMRAQGRYTSQPLPVEWASLRRAL